MHIRHLNNINTMDTPVFKELQKRLTKVQKELAEVQSLLIEMVDEAHDFGSSDRSFRSKPVKISPLEFQVDSRDESDSPRARISVNGNSLVERSSDIPISDLKSEIGASESHALDNPKGKTSIGEESCIQAMEFRPLEGNFFSDARCLIEDCPIQDEVIDFSRFNYPEPPEHLGRIRKTMCGYYYKWCETGILLSSDNFDLVEDYTFEEGDDRWFQELRVCPNEDIDFPCIILGKKVPEDINCSTIKIYDSYNPKTPGFEKAWLTNRWPTQREATYLQSIWGSFIIGKPADYHLHGN
jgi:hypothetical protein